MSRARFAFAVVAVSAAAAAGCVTTQTVPDRSPDPRDDEPALSAADQQQIAMRQRGELSKEHPLRVVDLTQAGAGHDPIVNIRVVFEAGSADDPAGKEGLAALTASLMREATEKLSAAELDDTLYPWAADLDVQVDKDTTVFVGRVHKDFAAPFSQVLLDVIAHPRLDKADFERKRAEQKSFLTSRLRTGDDEMLQREELEAVLYPAGHPYHHTPSGTVKGLDAITLDDVRAFIRTQLTRDRVVLGVSGGAPHDVVASLTRGLDGLPFSTAPRVAALPPALPAATHAVLVDKPAAAGTAISIGYVLPKLARTDPDYPAMKLAETWFGEHRSLIGHLFHSMREVRGLNYGDYAYVEHFVQAGWSTYEELNIPRRTQYFSMWIRPVEHKNRLFALRQAVWELQKFAKDGIPDDESFQRVQNFVQGYWRAKEQEPMRKLGYAVDKVLTGQPFDHDDLRAMVKKLTRADVNAAIARHLHGDKLAVVVVTQGADQLADAIVANKPSPLASAGKLPKEIVDEDKVIEALDLHLARGDVRIVPATTLFEE